MNAIDMWLDEASFALRGTLAQQQAMRDELRAHIADAAREHEMRGLSHDAAVALALADLGDAAEVGRSFRPLRRGGSLRRPLVQPEGALILDRRAVYRLPHRALAVALAGGGAMAAVVALRFIWPG